MLREKDNCHSTNSNYPWGNAENPAVGLLGH
jgi:hypothetical protein